VNHFQVNSNLVNLIGISNASGVLSKPAMFVGFKCISAGGKYKPS
jgi:hypothetical protein